MKKTLTTLLIITTFSFAQCKKQRVAKTELEKLPPATQTGANTFGCLLNGKAFMPGGGGLLDQVLTVQYDPTYGMGSLRITAKSFLSGSNYISMSLHGDTINTIGNYLLAFESKYSVFYFNTYSQCTFNTYDPPPPTITSGGLNVKKFDTNNRIISGTFSFNVSTSACGTIEATDGRFDVKY